MNTICIDRTIFMISTIILITIAMVFFVLNMIKNYELIKLYNKNNKNKNNTNKNNDISFFDYILGRDYRALNDPLSPNERRVDISEYPRSPLIQSMNIATRGYPDTYQYMGNLVRSTDERVIKLMGRETYPGSWQFEYYGLTTDPNGTEYKVNIDTKGKEIQDGSSVVVNNLDPSKGNFIASMNKYDTPRYNPYVLY